jgi:DNA-binding MarR family transcriptional regulator
MPRAPRDVDFGPLPRYIGYRVRLAQSAIFRDLGRGAKDPGMTPGEFSLMTVVSRNRGIDAATLARTYGLDKTTLSITLKRLGRAGLVASERRKDDRRHLALRLTPAGEEAVHRAARRIEAQERLMDSVLGPGERERLLELLGRIPAVLCAN